MDETNEQIMTDESDQQISKTKWFNKGRGRRFLKFVIIGLFGWGINELVIYLSTLTLDAITTKDPLFFIGSLRIEKVLIASFIGICFAVTFNFTINKIWTFGKNEQTVERKWFIQLSQFILVSFSGLAIYLGFVYIFATLLSLNKYAMTSIGYLLGLVNNFVWNDLWTFRQKRKDELEDQEELEEELPMNEDEE